MSFRIIRYEGFFVSLQLKSYKIRNVDAYRTMKQLKELLGYLLGLVLFVGLIPALMWLASGRPDSWSEVVGKDFIAWGLMLCGLLLSIWTIIYMKLRGKGNPMDAFGHEVAPRTQNLSPVRLTLWVQIRTGLASQQAQFSQNH